MYEYIKKKEYHAVTYAQRDEKVEERMRGGMYR